MTPPTLTACPTREELRAYATGKVDEPVLGRISEHVDTCLDCQAAIATLDDALDSVVAGIRAAVASQPYGEEPQCSMAIARAEAIVVRPCSSSEPPARGDSEPPELSRLGEYRLLEKLGEGGMGAVYRAEQTRLKRVVALKVLPKERTADPRAAARFEREMEAIGRLSHANVVQAHDAREIDGTAVLVMEYVDGLSLGELLRRTGKLPIAEACELARQAAVGLDYVHRQGLIHRDVKPSNLMLDRQGQVKILDLGLALLRVHQPQDGAVTASGQAMGTADYIAPEQVSDSHGVDVRADIYSLGCTLYALLAGRPPFHAGRHATAVAKMAAHLQEEPAPLRQVRSETPPRLAALVGRMMAKRAEDRFPTAREVAEALGPFCQGADLPALIARATAAPAASGAAERPEQRPPQSVEAGAGRRRLIRTTIAAAAAFSLILLGIVIRIRTKDGPDVTIHVPPGSTVTFQEEGQPEVVTSGKGEAKEAARPAAMKPAEVSAKPAVEPKPAPVSVAIEPEPLATQVGAPMSSEALVVKPARIPGVRSWTIDTRAHRGSVGPMAVSPDGKTVASGGWDGSVRLREMATGQLVRILVGAHDEITALAWSPDGKTLAVCAASQVGLWNPLTGQRVRLLESKLPLQSIAWAPDSKRLATGSGIDGEILLWDAGSGVVQRTLQGGRSGTGAIWALAWLPDGRRLVGQTDGNLDLWDLDSGKLLCAVKAGSWIAVASDGKQLLSGEGGDNGLRWHGDKALLWQIDSDRLTGPRTLETVGRLRPPVFMPDAKTALWASGRDVLSCDLSTGTSTPVAKDKSGIWLSTRDGKLLASSDVNQDVMAVVELSSGRTLWEVPGHDVPARQVKWSPDGRNLLTLAGGGVRVYNILSGRCEFQPNGHDRGTGAWSLDGNALFLQEDDGGGASWVSLWDWRSKSRSGTLPVGSVLVMAPSPDGKTLATGGGTDGNSVPRRVELWDLDTKKKLREFSNSDGLADCLAFSCDGALLAMAQHGSGAIDLLETQTGKRIRTISGKYTEWRSLAFSPDGKLLAAPGALFDVETGECLTVLRGQQFPTTVVWLRDGKTFATGGLDRTLRFWVAATGMSQRVVDAPVSAVLSPDETLVAGIRKDLPPGTQGSDSIQVTDAHTGRLLQSIVGLSGGKHLTLCPDGHYVGSPRVEREIVYVVETDAGQETLTPEEFAKRYGWKNNPTKVTLTGKPSEQESAGTEGPDRTKPAESKP